MSMSQIVGILALASQVITVALGSFAGIIPPKVQLALHAVLAAIQAVTGRVQGAPK